MDDLRLTIRQAIEHIELKRENLRLIQKINDLKRTLKNLENDQPGITKVKRDSDGAVII